MLILRNNRIRALNTNQFFFSTLLSPSHSPLNSSPDSSKFSSSQQRRKLTSSVSAPLIDSNPMTAFWTIPNVITLTRMAMSPLIAVAIAADLKDLALAGCIFGAFSDWLDGYIAKNHNLKVLLPLALDLTFSGRVSGVGSWIQLLTRSLLAPLQQG
jgi:hypothetical protein